MRLTKKQLKRIIREEYSRLKRRGLISEDMGAPMGAPVAGGMSHPAEDLCALCEEQLMNFNPKGMFTMKAAEAVASFIEEGFVDDSHVAEAIAGCGDVQIKGCLEVAQKLASRGL